MDTLENIELFDKDSSNVVEELSGLDPFTWNINFLANFNLALLAHCCKLSLPTFFSLPPAG